MITFDIDLESVARAIFIFVTKILVFFNKKKEGIFFIPL